MSYDLGLRDPITGSELELGVRHHMRGGTFQLGGCPTADINITYNYARHYEKVLPGGGIRRIYGMSGAASIPILKAAIDQLGDDVSDNYWEGTEGNAKRALQQCLALAQMRPDGVWDGD